MQLEILNNAANYLKLDGTLVYSVCTTEPEEGEKMIEKFLEMNPNFARIDMPEGFPIATQDGELRTFPNTHGIDGFYISKLVKRYNKVKT